MCIRDRDTWSDEHMGMMSCTILARSRDDFEAIREEAERRRQEYNVILGEDGYELIYRNRPYDQEKSSIAFSANQEPDVEQHRRQRMIIFIILLIVPAINLSSMTQSRLRQRVAEIGVRLSLIHIFSELGVRKTYGATNMRLIGQVLWENLLLTCIGGLLGLLISYLIVLTASDWILTLFDSYTDVEKTPFLSFEMLFNPTVFCASFGLCVLLNLIRCV